MSNGVVGYGFWWRIIGIRESGFVLRVFFGVFVLERLKGYGLLCDVLVDSGVLKLCGLCCCK